MKKNSLIKKTLRMFIVMVLSVCAMMLNLVRADAGQVSTTIGTTSYIVVVPLEIPDLFPYNPIPSFKPKLVGPLMCVLGATIVVYGVYRCIIASGINADPPIDPAPLPLPPKRPKPPKPPTKTSPPAGSKITANTTSTSLKLASVETRVYAPIFVVPTNSSGQMVGVAYFWANNLNSLYSTVVDGVTYTEKNYVDPDGNPYLTCETFILQSAPNPSGPWVDQIQVYIWNNSIYCASGTYLPDSYDVVESVLINRKIDITTTGVNLQSLIDTMKVDISTNQKYFRLKEGAPTWHAP